jgi:hypothetical protein
MKTTALLITALFFLAACKKNQADVTPPQLDIPVINTDDISYFVPFGFGAEPGQESNGYEVGFKNPDAYITAGCGGIVASVNPVPDFSDYTIEVQLSSQSMYHIYYQQVSRPRVTAGQVVLAGDTLGQAGRAGPLLFRIQNTRYGYAVCPRFYGNNTFNLSFDRAMAISNALHNTQFTSTCIKEKVTP